MEMVCSDLDSGQVPRDPDDVQCTGAAWRRLVLNRPVLYSSTWVMVG